MKMSRNNSRIQRKRRIRAKISGSAVCPRLCVYRSNVAIYAQLIDDGSGKTLLCADSKSLKTKSFDIAAAKKVGELIAKKAKEQKIVQAVFDRGGYKYHGKVKALAEGAREGGLKF